MARRKSGPRAWVRVSHRTKDSKVKRWEVVYETGAFRADMNGCLVPVRRTKGGFEDKSAAERWMGEESPTARFHHKLAWVDPAKGDITFQQVAEHWLKMYVSESGKVRGRAQHYGIIHGRKSLVRTRWGDVRIGDIGHGDITDWVAELSRTKSASTMRHNFYTFRLVLRDAVARGLILTDPTVSIKLPKQHTLRVQQARRHALTAGQAQALIAATPEPWSMYTRLAAATGLRPEELTGLQLRDLDIERWTIRVMRVWVKDEINKCWIYEDNGKTPAARRSLRLDDYTVVHLRGYLAEHTEALRTFFAAHPRRVPVDPQAVPLFPGVGVFRRGQRQRQRQADLDAWEFIDQKGQPSALQHGWFTRRYWESMRTAASLPRTATFYDLRHFYGSWHAARLGQPGALTLAELAESMGHASTQMTLDRYVHSEPDVDKRNAGAAMWATDDVGKVIPFPNRA